MPNSHLVRCALLVLLGLAALTVAARGQDRVVAAFDGTATKTTGTFAVQDKWELRWSGASSLTVTVANPDGSVAGGARAIADGSLYEPKGGTFYLQVDGMPAAGATTWHLDVVELGPQAGTGSGAYVPPISLPPPSDTASMPTAVPTTAASPVTAAAPAPAAPQITDAQTRAIVLIQGDLAQGTGFLAHDRDGTPVVVTNHHVIFANPNLKITTTDGRAIPVLAYRGATDRDLVMLTIKDDHYAYLDLASDVDRLVHEQDEVLTPGNSQGGGVFLDTPGQIRAVGPDTVEISNPIFHGNSGGPVLHVASGKVVGVVARGEAVRATDALDAASLANSNSAISGAMRYFAVRIDTVSTWETYDLNRFLTESTFLRDFRRQSRLLDSALNGSRYEKAGLSVSDNDENRPPTAHFFQQDDHLRSLMQNYHDQTRDVDKSQQMDAVRELCSDLSDYASVNMVQIQQPENFYQFDQLRAKEEVVYRQHLIDELDHLDDRISDLGH